MNIVIVKITDPTTFHSTWVEQHAFYSADRAMYLLVASVHNWAANRCAELKAEAEDDWQTYDYSCTHFSLTESSVDIGVINVWPATEL